MVTTASMIRTPSAATTMSIITERERAAILELKKVNEPLVVRAAAETIQKAAILHPRSAGALLKPVGHLAEHVRPLMQRHDLDPVVTTAGVAIVSTLAYNQWTTASKDVQPYLAGLFGEALVRLLSHAHSTVQAEAARAIWSISYLSPQAQDLLAVRHNCIPPLVSLLKASKTETVIVYAAEAIWSLTTNNLKTVQPLVLAQNGLQALTRLLEHNDQFVQLAALSALPTLFACVPAPGSNFSANIDRYISPDVQRRFQECGGPLALLSVIKKSDKPDVLIKGSEVVYCACFLNGEVPRLLFNESTGGVGVLVRLLQHATFPELQKAACIAILGASYSNYDIGKHFVEGKAIEALVTIVKAIPHGQPPTPVALAAAYTISCLAYRNNKAQKLVLSTTVVNDILQWLPMPEKTQIDRAKLSTVRLALRCLAEMLSPETVQEDTRDGKLATSKRADPDLQKFIWRAVGLNRFYYFLSDPELVPTAAILLGNAGLQNEIAHDDLGRVPGAFKLIERMLAWVRQLADDKSQLPTVFNQLTMAIQQQTAAASAFCLILQDNPSMTTKVLNAPEVMVIVRAAVKRADTAGRVHRDAVFAQQSLKRKHDAIIAAQQAAAVAAGSSNGSASTATTIVATSASPLSSPTSSPASTQPSPLAISSAMSSGGGLATASSSSSHGNDTRGGDGQPATNRPRVESKTTDTAVPDAPTH